MKKKKIPWCDIYICIIKGSELRKDEESKEIGDKIIGNILRENVFLRKKLARWESVPDKKIKS